MADNKILNAEYTGSRVDESNRQAAELANKEYKFGWETIVESDTFPPGLNEEVIKAISVKKNEPDWLLEWRLKAYRQWLKMK